MAWGQTDQRERHPGCHHIGTPGASGWKMMEPKTCVVFLCGLETCFKIGNFIKHWYPAFPCVSFPSTLCALVHSQHLEVAKYEKNHHQIADRHQTLSHLIHHQMGLFFGALAPMSAAKALCTRGSGRPIPITIMSR